MQSAIIFFVDNSGYAIREFLSVNTVTCESEFPAISCNSQQFCSAHDFIVHG